MQTDNLLIHNMTQILSCCHQFSLSRNSGLGLSRVIGIHTKTEGK